MQLACSSNSRILKCESNTTLRFHFLSSILELAICIITGFPTPEVNTGTDLNRNFTLVKTQSCSVTGFGF
jgi:hypothetical protein